MIEYKIISSTSEVTVVSEYEPQQVRSDAYQSEADLEAAFIKMLVGQGYEYVTTHHEKELIANLHIQLERLNQYSFNDSKWDIYFKTKIANSNDGVVEKTKKLQENYIQNLAWEDGGIRNIRFDLQLWSE